MPRRARFRAIAIAMVVLAPLALSLPTAVAVAGKRIQVTKFDENFQGHAGVTFELYKDNPPQGGTRGAEDTLVQTKVTGQGGVATFTGVAQGQYWVHEVTPAGYTDLPDDHVDKRKDVVELIRSNTPKPSNNRVNDPTGDTAFGDGTHIFDFGPSVGVAPGGSQVLVAWNHSAGFLSPGGVSGTTTGLSTDLGEQWGDYSKVPTGSGSTAILGDPEVIFDPIGNRWVVANQSVTNTGSGFEFPIVVSTSGGTFGFWNDPVNTFPDIPASPASAHGPSITVDPVTGEIIVAFTLSQADATSETMVTSSSDGVAWTDPSSVSGPGHNDFVNVGRGPDNRIYATWVDFGEAANNSFLVSRSTDGGDTWGPPVNVGTVPKSGTPGLCKGSNARSVLGQVVALDAPEIVVSPFHKNRVYVAFPGHGQAGDESDIFLVQSNDGGATWSPPETIGPTSGAQFSPSVAVTPDGRVAVAYYDTMPAPTPEVNWVASFFDVFSTDPRVVDSISMVLSENPSLMWETNPPYDDHYSSCHGLVPGDITAPGSGFFTAWTDGRDPGPAGNNGIDPNVYFARTEGPLVGTELDVSVGKTATNVKVRGEVVPRPLVGARVTVTLFRDDGSGFDKLARKRPTTDKVGAWATSFARPSGGTCRIVVEFGGSEGREPSVPVTKTFAC